MIDFAIDFLFFLFFLQKNACSQCREINCCGWLIAQRFKPFTVNATTAFDSGWGCLCWLYHSAAMWAWADVEYSHFIGKSLLVFQGLFVWKHFFLLEGKESFGCSRIRAIKLYCVQLQCWHPNQLFPTNLCLYSPQNWKHFNLYQLYSSVHPKDTPDIVGLLVAWLQLMTFPSCLSCTLWLVLLKKCDYANMINHHG